MVTAAARSSRASWDDLPQGWADLFRDHLPDYDPVATAAPGEWFDEAAADAAVEFIEGWLVFVEGEKAGQPFQLEDWQKAIVGCLFGWKRADGLRRCRECLIYVPRKNGKTPICAAIVLYSLFCEDEPGAQLVCAAADREQASHVFRHAAHMTIRNPKLDKHVKIYRTYKSIELAADGSVFKALSSEADTKHGGNLSLVIVDELHKQKSRDLVDTLCTGTGSRRQPLMIYITTADFDRESICNEKHDYACKVRDKKIADSAFLPVIYETSKDADWKDPKVWEAANPNLGVSVRRDYLERECQRAIDQPAYENTFKRLHLNIKTSQQNAWRAYDNWIDTDMDVDPVSWRRDTLEMLKGQKCIAGFDLSQTRDVTALALLFWRDDEDERIYTVLPWFWIPGKSADVAERRDRVPYAAWERQGFVEMTEGNSVDYRRIREVIHEIREEYDILEIAGDPYNALQLMHDLETDGFTVWQVRQAMVSMSPGTKELDRLVGKNRVHHGQNPVLRWMAGNVEIDTDKRDNIMPTKASKNARIDGIAATIIALTRAMTIEVEGDSVYESRGPIVFGD